MSGGMTGRGCHGVGVLEGKLYAVGGVDSDEYGEGTLSSVERYDPALNVWEAVAPMAEKRYGHAVAVLEGRLYAAGGWDDSFSPLNSVQVHPKL